MELFKNLLSQMKQQDTTKHDDTEKLVEYGDDCDHSRKEEIFGSVFCVECGIEFENEINYQWYSESTDSSSDDERSSITDHHIMRDTRKSTIPPPSPPPPSPTSTDDTKSVGTIIVRSRKELTQLAKERKVGYYSRKSTKELCEALGAKISKPLKIMFVNSETGHQRGFESINQASKELGVNPGLIHYYMGKEMKIGDETYLVSKL